MPVALMQQRARIFSAMLVNDQSAFMAQTGIDAGFISNFSSAITAGENAETTDEAEAWLTTLTQAAENVLEEARMKVQALFRYAELAFPGDSVRQNAYGKRQYEKASTSRWQMVKLMEQAYDMAVIDATALSNQGFTAARLAAFDAVRVDLNAKDTTQGLTKETLKVKTQAYYAAQNNVWSRMKTLNTAAQIVFAGNYGKLEAYRLYETANGPNAFTMVLPQGNVDVLHHFINALQPTTTITFQKLEGSEAATVCFAQVQNDPCTGTTKTLSNILEQVEYSTFNAGGGMYMRCRQPGPGEMRLRVIVG